MKIIIHSDFDGLACGVLLSERFKPKYVMITEPNQIRDGKIKLTKEDIVADLPLPPNEVYMAFDHHRSSSMIKMKGDWFIIDPNAPSCARVIYNEYEKSCPAIKKWKQMVNIADKLDTANFTLKEYGNHDIYTKISMTLKSFDKELDKFYIRYLIKKLLALKSFDKVSKLDWVVERYKYKLDSIKRWKEVIGKYVTCKDKIIIVDIRDKKEFIPRGDPFELYKMYPDSLVSISIADIATGETLISLSQNIFNRKNKVDLGSIASKYNGGGHKGAAGFSVEKNQADKVLKTIIKEIKNGNKAR